MAEINCKADDKGNSEAKRFYDDVRIIGTKGSEEFLEKVMEFLFSGKLDNGKTITDANTNKNIYLRNLTAEQAKDKSIKGVVIDRFDTGEGKVTIHDSMRDVDLYIFADVFNYGATYTMYQKERPMSPDEHYQDLLRIISATAGKARRITVIMPMLYEGRQHRRKARESLDCAMMLQELVHLGVDNILTFDAHDPNVQNAIPMSGFDNVHPTYQFIKALLNKVPDIILDENHTMVISPDQGAMDRCIDVAHSLGSELGMFYKRRDYTRVVNGRNPILEHKYIGSSVKGKDVIIVDDMIASGESTLDVAKKLKDEKANRVFIFATFGLFVKGLKKFDEAYERGDIDTVFTTNLIYTAPELEERPWYQPVYLNKYVAMLIDTLSDNHSLSKLLTPSDRIDRYVTDWCQKHNQPTPEERRTAKAEADAAKPEVEAAKQ